MSLYHYLILYGWYYSQEDMVRLKQLLLGQREHLPRNFTSPVEEDVTLRLFHERSESNNSCVFTYLFWDRTCDCCIPCLFCCNGCCCSGSWLCNFWQCCIMWPAHPYQLHDCTCCDVGRFCCSEDQKFVSGQLFDETLALQGLSPRSILHWLSTYASSFWIRQQKPQYQQMRFDEEKEPRAKTYLDSIRELLDVLEAKPADEIQVEGLQLKAPSAPSPPN
jgi:hypothetical protein